MPLIIDTYNALHTQGALPAELAGIELGDLMRMIEFSRFARQRCHLVCDGTPAAGAPRGEHGRISIVYAGGGRSADDVIVAMLDAASHPRQITVVSSDQQVLRAARRRHCKRMTSHSFLTKMASDLRPTATARPVIRPRKPGGPLTPEQVRREIERFALDEREMHTIEQARIAPPPSSRARAPSRAASGQTPRKDHSSHVHAAPDQRSGSSRDDPMEDALDLFGFTAEEIAAIERTNQARRPTPLTPPPATPIKAETEPPPAMSHRHRSREETWKATASFPEDVLAEADRLLGEHDARGPRSD
jgi:predicted RNA-binding protein with PIN domain